VVVEKILRPEGSPAAIRPAWPVPGRARRRIVGSVPGTRLSRLVATPAEPSATPIRSRGA